MLIDAGVGLGIEKVSGCLEGVDRREDSRYLRSLVCINWRELHIHQLLGL